MAKPQTKNQGETKEQDKNKGAEGNPGAANAGAKQEVKKAIYISRYRELRLVTKSAYSKEVDGRIVTYPGTAIQFRDGVFETEDPQEIKLLEGHKNFGNIFIKVEAGTKEAKQIRDEKYKDLEQRNKELAAKLAAAEEENKRLKDEGGDGDEKGDVDGAGAGKEGEQAAY
jgi:hypothetical protein